MTATTEETPTPRKRAHKPDPIRDAIRENGTVKVKLENPDDPAEKKRTVNKIFGRAYTLGLKGQFGVRVEDGYAIGQVKQSEPETAAAAE